MQVQDGSERDVSAVGRTVVADRSSAPARPSSFRVDIQGLRAVAVILVVLYHADTPLVGGFVGVDVFFAISGFVIARLLLRELEARDSIDLGRFYSRRIRRLVPALGVMLLGVGLAAALLLSPLFPQQVALETGAWAAASAANIYLWFFGGGYFNPLDEQNPFVHTWSLGIEEQFYLFFPALVAGAWAWGRRRGGDPEQALRRVMTVVVVVSFLISLVMAHDLFGAQDRLPGGDRFAFYGPIGRAWEFGVGVLLALYMGRRDAVGPRWLGAAGLATLLVTAVVLDGSVAFPGVAAVPPVAATIVLMLCGGGSVRPLLEHRLMVWIGDRSYGWYLWHWPFIVFAELLLPDVPFVALLAAFVSLAPTVVSYRYVESRFRAGSGPTAVRGGAVPIAIAFAAVPLVLLAGASVVPTGSWGLRDHPERAEMSLSGQLNCFVFESSVEKCTVEPGGDVEGTVLLIGDSHSAAISSAVHEAAEANGHRLIMRNVLSCPFAIAEQNFHQECQDHNAEVVALAEEVRPDVVIIANRSTAYPAKFDFDWRVGNIEVTSVASDASITLWEDAFGAGVRAIEAHTNRIVVFSVVPHFGVPEYDASLPSVLRPGGAQPILRVDEIQELRLPVLEAEARALSQVSTPTIVIDPLDALCEETCDLTDDQGRYLYRDPSHLTPLGASRFASDFSEVLAGS